MKDISEKLTKLSKSDQHLIGNNCMVLLNFSQYLNLIMDNRVYYDQYSLKHWLDLI